jgi:hypothetical protein
MAAGRSAASASDAPPRRARPPRRAAARMVLKFSGILLAIAGLVLCVVARSAADIYAAPFQYVDHINFGCSLEAGRREIDSISETYFCDIARRALEDLASGNLEPEVVRQNSLWASIPSPQAAVEKCRAGVSQPMPAGECEQIGFELDDRDKPLPIEVKGIKEVTKDDQAGIPVTAEGTQKKSDNGVSTINITIRIVERFIARPPVPANIVELHDLVEVKDHASLYSVLHERFQLLWARYFNPLAFNVLRGRAQLTTGRGKTVGGNP